MKRGVGTLYRPRLCSFHVDIITYALMHIPIASYSYRYECSLTSSFMLKVCRIQFSELAKVDSTSSSRAARHMHMAFSTWMTWVAGWLRLSTPHCQAPTFLLRSNQRWEKCWDDTHATHDFSTTRSTFLLGARACFDILWLRTYFD